MKQEICKCKHSKRTHTNNICRVAFCKCTNYTQVEKPQEDNNENREQKNKIVQNLDSSLNSSVAQQPNVDKIYKKLYRKTLGYEDNIAYQTIYRNALKDFRKELIKNGK